MVALYVASLVLTQTAPTAVVLTGPKVRAGVSDAELYSAAGYRAEAAAEGLLRTRGFLILDSKRAPEFAPRSSEEALELLRVALKTTGASAAVGIQVVSVNVTKPNQAPKPIEATMSGKPVQEKIKLPDPTRAEVTVKVWLLESGETRPYIDGKTPCGYESGHGQAKALVGSASRQAIEDVLRRFLRLRFPRGG